MVALIGVCTGDFPALSLLTLVPVQVASSLLFSGVGLAAAALAQSIDAISYPQYLLIFPMFLLCGVFYPIDNLPAVLQAMAWALPLMSVNSPGRTLALGTTFQPHAVAILVAWLVGLLLFSRRAMVRRLLRTAFHGRTTLRGPFAHFFQSHFIKPDEDKPWEGND